MTGWTSVMVMGQAGGQAGGMTQMFLPMIVIFGIFYFMLIRPQQRKEKERRKMIDELKSGTRVLFSGGIIGTVTNVKDKTFVVKIAENVKIEVARGAVSKVLGDEESDIVVDEK